MNFDAESLMRNASGSVQKLLALDAAAAQVADHARPLLEPLAIEAPRWGWQLNVAHKRNRVVLEFKPPIGNCPNFMVVLNETETDNYTPRGEMEPLPPVSEIGASNLATIWLDGLRDQLEPLITRMMTPRRP